MAFSFQTSKEKIFSEFYFKLHVFGEIYIQLLIIYPIIIIKNDMKLS